MRIGEIAKDPELKGFYCFNCQKFCARFRTSWKKGAAANGSEDRTSYHCPDCDGFLQEEEDDTSTTPV